MRSPIVACRLFSAALAVCWASLALSGLAAEPQKLFALLDTNEDGQLSIQEIDADHTRLFTRLLRSVDANDDNQLSAAEFEVGLMPQRLAKPLPKKQGGKFPGSDALLLLLARMDVNGDRTLTADEIPEDYQSFFNQVQSRIGGKEDGKITQRELVQAAPRLSQMALRFVKQHDIDVDVEIALLPEKQWAMIERMGEPSRPGDMLSDPNQAKELFGRLDANDDGQVTAEEVPPPFVDRFEQLLLRADQNSDGQLSKKELLTFSKRMQANEKNRPPQAEIDRRLTDLFSKFDRDGDKLISRKEAPRRLAARFDRVDADGNGNLDRQELSRVVGLLNQVRKPKVEGSRKKRPKKKP